MSQYYYRVGGKFRIYSILILANIRSILFFHTLWNIRKQDVFWFLQVVKRKLWPKMGQAFTYLMQLIFVKNSAIFDYNFPNGCLKNKLEKIMFYLRTVLTLLWVNSRNAKLCKILLNARKIRVSLKYNCPFQTV